MTGCVPCSRSESVPKHLEKRRYDSACVPCSRSESVPKHLEKRRYDSACVPCSRSESVPKHLEKRRYDSARRIGWFVLPFFLASCATVQVPMSVTFPPAVDLSPYRRFAFGDMNGNSGRRFQDALATDLARSKKFNFINRDRLNVLVAEYDLTQTQNPTSAKTGQIAIEIHDAAFISGTINKNYYEFVRESPDTCQRNNRAHPCPLRTRVGRIRIGGHLDVMDAATGRLIHSQTIAKVCQAQSQAKNAFPEAINRAQLAENCVNSAAYDLAALFLPSRKMFYPDFKKVGDIPAVAQGIKDVEAGKIGEAAKDFSAALKDPKATSRNFSKKSLSEIYWDGALAQEYSWQFGPALDSLKKSYALNPLAETRKEESQLLGLESARRRLLGVTPLMLAVEGGAFNQVKALLEKGADPNAQDVSGNTALMGAAQKRNLPMVQILLRYGAWPSIRNNQGLSAQDMSRDQKISNLLSENFSKPSAPRQEGALPSPKAVIHSDVDQVPYHFPEDPFKIALVIGIEHYENNLPSADFADHDAEVMREHLMALGYAPRHIHWLKDQQATRAALVKNLEGWLPQVVSSSATVFVYYSGHGAADPETHTTYLVPADGDSGYLQETAYPLSRLYLTLGKLPAKQVIVALDSCFSGRGARSLSPAGVRPLVTLSPVVPLVEGVVAMTAASGTQIAEVLNSEGHGLFTYYFLKGLNGPAKNKSNKISVQSLYRYLRPQVEDAAGMKNRTQTPELLPGSVAHSNAIVLVP